MRRNGVIFAGVFVAILGLTVALCAVVEWYLGETAAFVFALVMAALSILGLWFDAEEPK